VLGGIFNKIPLEGFYNVESCRTAITSYFRQYRKMCKAYGFIPVMENIENEGYDDELSTILLEVFMASVAVQDIVGDALNAQVPNMLEYMSVNYPHNWLYLTFNSIFPLNQFEEDCKNLLNVTLRQKSNPIPMSTHAVSVEDSQPGVVLTAQHQQSSRSKRVLPTPVSTRAVRLTDLHCIVCLIYYMFFKRSFFLKYVGGTEAVQS
jgi:hypothetical protein